MIVEYREINHLLNQYKKAVRKQSWTKSFFEDLKNEITYHSNKIEGLTLTYGETIQFLKYGLISSAEESKVKEITDLKNHRQILDLFFENYNHQEFSIRSMKEIHKELLNNPYESVIDVYKTPGEFKGEINGTMRQEKGKTYFHEYMDPISVPYAMDKLIKQINEKLNRANPLTFEFHPITISAQFHYQFANVIHPFHDGNGRLARLYTNLILMKNGFPAIIIKGEDEDREKYIQSLILSEKESSAMPLIKLILEQLKSIMNLGLAKARSSR